MITITTSSSISVSAGGGQLLVVVVVLDRVLHRDDVLGRPQGGNTGLCPGLGFACLAQRREEDADEQRDNRDHHQELDERKAVARAQAWTGYNGSPPRFLGRESACRKGAMIGIITRSHPGRGGSGLSRFALARPPVPQFAP